MKKRWSFQHIAKVGCTGAITLTPETYLTADITLLFDEPYFQIS